MKGVLYRCLFDRSNPAIRLGWRISSIFAYFSRFLKSKPRLGRLKDGESCKLYASLLRRALFENAIAPFRAIAFTPQMPHCAKKFALRRNLSSRQEPQPQENGWRAFIFMHNEQTQNHFWDRGCMPTINKTHNGQG